MREHHALRNAGAAAREDDGRERLGVALRPRRAALSSRAGSRSAIASIASLGDRRECLAGRPRGTPCRRSARCPAFARNTRDVRMVVIPHRSIAAAIASRPGREVQVDRHLAGQRRRDVGERAADRRRQQQPDVRLARRVAANPPRRAAGRPTSARPKVSALAAWSRPCRTTTSGASPCGRTGGRALRARAGGCIATLARRAPSAPAALPPPSSSTAAARRTRRSPDTARATGHFQKNRPPLKLKMLPQTRSR